MGSALMYLAALNDVKETFRLRKMELCHRPVHGSFPAPLALNRKCAPHLGGVLGGNVEPVVLWGLGGEAVMGSVCPWTPGWCVCVLYFPRGGEGGGSW